MLTLRYGRFTFTADAYPPEPERFSHHLRRLCWRSDKAAPVLTVLSVAVRMGTSEVAVLELHDSCELN